MRKQLALFIAALATSSAAYSFGTAFSFQGSLEDGAAPANGSYDLQFRLMNPTSVVQIGSILVFDNVAVVGGVFTVQLDFGAGVLSGFERAVEVGVRPGVSSAAFTILAPLTPLHPAPYAQYARFTETAELATSVSANSISSSRIVDGAVTVTKIADDAVRDAQIADNAVTLNKLLGGQYTSPANLNAGIGANACAEVDLSVAGGFVTGDFVIGMTNSTFPSNVIFSTGRVVSSNVVRMRFCNVGNTAQSMVNEQIRLVSLR